MAGILQEINPVGFSFNNCKRNEFILKDGNFTIPKAMKTGTTIVGLVYKDGVILGADTRATNDTIVADKNCEKIHRIADFIYCCGAGTAADTEMTTRMIESNMELIKLNSGRQPRVGSANTMLKQFLYRYQGHISAALILGGVDVTGPHLFTIYPHGSSCESPYTTMGSGSLAAMAVFESRYRIDMEKAEAMKLVNDAIASGIFNDLGSGSNIDLCVITKEKLEHLRPYNISNQKGVRQGKYDYKKGTTEILWESVEMLGEDILGTEVDICPPRSNEPMLPQPMLMVA